MEENVPATQTSRSSLPLPPPPPLEEQPDLKRLKMSSTTTTSDEEDTNANTTATRKERYKRRKAAIFFANCGVGYQGMQKNPGAKTIEADLEEALYLSGAVPEQDRGNSKRYDSARSTRTDKGVSAVGQVVSGRFYIDPPGFVDRLNSNLSPQIRIFGRSYVYLIPVFALYPNAHRDRESVLASMGSGNELVKCLEFSERGRKVIGVMGKRNFETKDGVTHSDISSSETNSLPTPKFNEEIRVCLVNAEVNNVSHAESRIEDEVTDLNSGSMNNLEVIDGEARVNGNEKSADKFRYGEKERERFNRILKYYVGTHNFHNFTTRTKAEDLAAIRFIVSFDANTTLTVQGMEFVKCEVVGQSFMLHQIRKMIGLAVAIVRNCASESLLERALQKDVNINVPTAPEVGLYLDECSFESYNHKWRDSHEEVSMKAYKEVAEEFKMKQIYSHIASSEHKDGAVGLCLRSLNHRNYPDLRFLEDDKGVEKAT